jgi:DNA-binding LacI/PurR family transcriptional regulator
MPSRPRDQSPPCRRVTIRDIAHDCGVHFTTVSQALRGSPKVKAETRRRIEEAALRMGYTPDPMLSALTRYRTNIRTPSYQGTIGWLNYFNTPDHFETEGKNFSLYLKGAKERAARLGYQIENIWVTAPELDEARVASILLARGVRGLLVAPLPVAGKRVDFPWHLFSVVKFGYTLQRGDLVTVTAQQFSNTRVLCRRLMAKGFRRIGLCLERGLDERVQRRFTAAYSAELPANRRTGRRLPVFFDKSETGDRTDFLVWFGKHRPDAIIVSRSCYQRFLEDDGVRVPQDVGVAYLSTMAGEPWASGINERSEAIGRVAVDQLASMIQRGAGGISTEPHTISLEGLWQEGRTIEEPSGAGGA